MEHAVWKESLLEAVAQIGEEHVALTPLDGDARGNHLRRDRPALTDERHDLKPVG